MPNHLEGPWLSTDKNILERFKNRPVAGRPPHCSLSSPVLGFGDGMIPRQTLVEVQQPSR